MSEQQMLYIIDEGFNLFTRSTNILPIPSHITKIGNEVTRGKIEAVLDYILSYHNILHSSYETRSNSEVLYDRLKREKEVTFHLTHPIFERTYFCFEEKPYLWTIYVVDPNKFPQPEADREKMVRLDQLNDYLMMKFQKENVDAAKGKFRTKTKR